MEQNSLRINDEFHEVGTRSVDSRNRLILGNLIDGLKRVKLYQNGRGELLLLPLLEVPASEMWLYKNKEAIQSVQKGLQDAAEGKISQLDLDEL